jgi:methionyl-tRNA formyltransferase
VSSAERCLVAGSRPWSRRVFDDTLVTYPGVWRFIGHRDELSAASVAEFGPDYIFFLHWSWKVPAEILRRYECVCFHMTDVPYGRGGSPLQNLIVRDHQHTKLTALRMVEEFDAGPVYLKEDLCLSGSAEEVFVRASRLSAKMIRTIIDSNPSPSEQIGEATVFRRRTPDQSFIPAGGSLSKLFDFIRMLDADGYPPACLEYAGFRFEFSRASLRTDRVVADVVIRSVENDKS